MLGCQSHESPSVDLCEVGQQAYDDALSAFVASSPRCTADDQCVHVPADVECSRFSVALCGVVVHRDIAANWDPEQVCSRLASYPRDTSCSIEASCAQSEPACEQGSCTARRAGAIDAAVPRPIDASMLSDAALDAR